jgi:hypothetical protein
LRKQDLPSKIRGSGGRALIEAKQKDLDRAKVSRLLLGALGEHEQRRLVIRLAEVDPTFRAELLSHLAPFKVFDIDLMALYAAALDRGDDPATARAELLDEARRRSLDLDELMSRFTFSDLFELGETTRCLFSWSMAESLLEQSRQPDINQPSARTSLYLASLVIDVVELLGRSAHSPFFPQVIDDFQARLGTRRQQLNQP